MVLPGPRCLYPELSTAGFGWKVRLVRADERARALATDTSAMYCEGASTIVVF